MEQYSKVQQLLKKEEGQKNRLPIYPSTVIQAVFDGKTGASLEAILAQFNSIYIQYQGSPEATRNIIPVEMRRAGLTITYMNMDSETITERATSAVQKDNDHWSLNINWTRVDELSLSGDIAVSANGTWIINGQDTGVKAVGPKGDAGITPWLKTIDNKLHFSYDNVRWEPCSENIAAYFRFNTTSSDGQGLSVGKFQISRDNKSWEDLSPEITNALRIAGYVATSSALPSGKPVGTIYGVGPTFATEDTAHTNPIYRLYVYDGSKWVDNGTFTSIAAGVVQETGNSETLVMSQKATTEKLSELGQKLSSQPKYEIVNAYIDGNTGLWRNVSSVKSYFYSVKKGDVVTIKATNDSIAFYAFLSSSSHTDGVQPNYVLPTLSNTKINVGQKVTVESVSDCYLFITGNIGTQYDYTPEYVVLVGQRLDDIESNIKQAEERIQAESERIDGLNKSTELVGKTKAVSFEWVNGGVLNDGTLSVSETYRYAVVDAKKGDVINVVCSKAIPPSYAPVSVLDGEVYKPLLTFDSDWSGYTYIADEDRQLVLTARPNISAQIISSEVFGYMREEYLREIKRINDAMLSFDSPNKKVELLAKWSNGQLTTNGAEQVNDNRRRTDFLYVGNFVLLRIESAKRYVVYYYDENKVLIQRVDVTDGSNTYKQINTIPWKHKENGIKYVRVWVDSTNVDEINISGDTMGAILNNRRLLNNRLVKCAAHQGINMHIKSDGLERSFGGNFLSSFWGSYLCGFDMNLVNHLFTKDGVPVCSHDNEVTVDSGNTITISRLTLEELNNYTINGENIPTLDSVIYLSKMLGLEVFLVNVDLDAEDDRLLTVLGLIDKYRMWDNTWLMCHSPTLERVIARNPKARIVLLANSEDRAENAVATANGLVNNYNDVMLWFGGSQDTSLIVDVASRVDSRVKIGCYDIADDNALVDKLPYLNVYTSHYSSFGASVRNVELGIAAKYPTIIQWENGNII